MKKHNTADAAPEDVVQPEDPILEEQTEKFDPEILEIGSSDGDDSGLEADELQLLLEEKDQVLKETEQKYLRMAAEYDNFRRRSQKEKLSLYTDSIAQVVKEWLPVLDNLDRAAQTVEQTNNPEASKIAEGVALIHKQACEVMTKLGVSEIDCLNKTFDPNLHDAVMHIEDENVGPSTVVEVLQKGYQRDDTVIRHSIVKVAN